MHTHPQAWRYVLPHDTGMNPHVANQILTLAMCKPRIRTGCGEGDIVIAYGSTVKGVPGALLYAFRVKRKIPFLDYMANSERGNALYAVTEAGLVRKKGGQFAKYHTKTKDLTKGLSGEFVMWSDEFVVRPQLAATTSSSPRTSTTTAWVNKRR